MSSPTARTLASAERPIILSGHSVRAVLDGRKTQTRRVAAPASWNLDGFAPGSGCAYWLYPSGNRGFSRCPYGIPGDRLWVRETFTLENCQEVGWHEPPFADGRPLRTYQHPDEGTWWEQPHYRATDPVPELVVDNDTGEPGCKWTPSIFMPRWASRLLLEVTEVRVQRLQEISEEDAVAEGVWPIYADKLGAVEEGFEYRMGFARAWDQINADRAPWASNPWVWIIGFRIAPVAAGPAEKPE